MYSLPFSVHNLIKSLLINPIRKLMMFIKYSIKTGLEKENPSVFRIRGSRQQISRLYLCSASCHVVKNSRILLTAMCLTTHKTKWFKLKYSFVPCF